MNLKKLILAGAYTVAGDVLFTHPIKRQVCIAHWSGGEECELTPEGQELIDEIFPKRAPKAPKSEE